NGVEWPRVMAARAELFVRHVPDRAHEAVGEAVEADLGIYGETHPGTRQMLALAAHLDWAPDPGAAAPPRRRSRIAWIGCPEPSGPRRLVVRPPPQVLIHEE